MATHDAGREVRVATFADALRRHRRAAGLTQEELAERAVMSPRGVRYLERGLRLPYPDTVRRLVAALELEPEEAQGLRSAASLKRRTLTGRSAASVLPVPYGDIVGRDAEVAAALDLLRQRRVRVVTITGAGGVGKTRLAIEIAEMLEPEYADGVLWVPLGGLDGANQVGAAIAQALGGREPAGLAEEDALVATLRQAHVLLLLDTFEHVVGAAPLVATLTARCQRISVLVTSRTPLRLAAEHEFRLDPLPVPPLDSATGAQAVAANPAVRLFSERARAIARDFVIDGDNAGPVALICRRLDGLPLALELAAARVRLFRPEEMLVELEHALDLLTDAPVDAAARHRSLRNTLTWSYALLDAPAQQLLRRLAVFAGGCTLAAISAVCITGGDEAFSVVDAMDALQRSSLLRREDPAGRTARYTLLDTIREFAAERLAADRAEEAAVRGRHADYYSTLAETLAARVEGPGQADAVTAIEEEHDNVRAALGWWRDQCDVERGLRLANALWMFWYIRGYASEGRGHLHALLALPGSAAFTGLRAKALLGAGQLARDDGDYAAARALMEDSVALYRAAGDGSGLRQALFGTGFVARTQDDHAAARELFGEALASARSAGDDYVAALALHHLGMMSAHVDDDPHAALPLLEESLALFRRVGFRRHIALVLGSLGDAERAARHYDRAAALLCESLTVMMASGQAHDIHWTLDALAQLSFERGAIVRAVHLAAAASGIRRNAGAVPPAIAQQRERWLGLARKRIGAAAFDDAWRIGLEWSPDDASAYALGEQSS